MGLFEDIGRKVETFKQRAEEASREQASAECADCGELIFTDRDACPECGSEKIVPRNEADAAGTDEHDSVDDGTDPEDEGSETDVVPAENSSDDGDAGPKTTGGSDGEGAED